MADERGHVEGPVIATDYEGRVLVLVSERDEEYGASWLHTSKLLTWFYEHGLLFRIIHDSVFLFNWIMILNKLVRALATPSNKDHWTDIQGYALLCTRHLDAQEEREE